MARGGLPAAPTKDPALEAHPVQLPPGSGGGGGRGEE